MSSREASERISPIGWWFCFLALCAASPFVFVLVQAYVARLVAPMLLALAVTSATALHVIVFGMNILGALLAAFATSFNTSQAESPLWRGWAFPCGVRSRGY
jgi:hypothetical protein